MSCAQPRNGGERDMLGGEIPPSGCVRSGAHKRGGFACAKPPAGFGPKPHMAIRVKCSLGSFNACWRRESGRSDANQPAEKTISRVSVEKTEHEKLNDERGVKPLPVKGQQRRSRIGKTLQGWVGEELLYSTPRNQRTQGRWKLCPSGSLAHTWQSMGT